MKQLRYFAVLMIVISMLVTGCSLGSGSGGAVPNSTSGPIRFTMNNGKFDILEAYAFVTSTIGLISNVQGF